MVQQAIGLGGSRARQHHSLCSLQRAVTSHRRSNFEEQGLSAVRAIGGFQDLLREVESCNAGAI